MDVLGAHLLGVVPGLIQAAHIQQAQLSFGIQLTEPCDGVVVEGGVDGLALHAHLPFQLQELLLDAGVEAFGGLDLDVHQGAIGLQQLIDLLEGGDLHTTEGLHAVAGIQLLQLGQGVVADLAVEAGGPVQVLVMDDHQFAVLAQVHVQLDAVRAHLHGQAESLQGILRGIGGSAPMSVDQCHIITSLEI